MRRESWVMRRYKSSSSSPHMLSRKVIFRLSVLEVGGEDRYWEMPGDCEVRVLRQSRERGNLRNTFT